MDQRRGLPYRWVNSSGSSCVQRWEGERRHHHTVRGSLVGSALRPFRDPRGAPHATSRHRPRGDQRLAGVLRQHARRAGPRPGALRDAPAAGAGAREAGGRTGAPQHRLHQLHPARARAVVPGRRGDRAPDPRVHPLERRGDGVQRQPQGPRGRRSHRDLPVGRQPLRGRLQPLLPRQGPPRRRRPDLHPGPRLAGHLRPRLPRGPAHRGAALPVPAGGPARPGQRPAVVPPPPADAGLLGVPDGLDGPHRAQRDLPGAVQPLPPQPQHQGHLRPAGLGVPR